MLFFGQGSFEKEYRHESFSEAFSETFFGAARCVLGIRTTPLFPGACKVIMRVAGIESRIELPYKTAEGIIEPVKRFLGRNDIPYKEAGDEIRMTDRKAGCGCPRFFVAEDGVVSFYTKIRFCERKTSRWDGFIREMKNALRT